MYSCPGAPACSKSFPTLQGLKKHRALCATWKDLKKAGRAKRKLLQSEASSKEARKRVRLSGHGEGLGEMDSSACDQLPPPVADVSQAGPSDVSSLQSGPTPPPPPTLSSSGGTQAVVQC